MQYRENKASALYKRELSSTILHTTYLPDYIKNTPQKIIRVNLDKIRYCPECKSALVWGYTFVPFCDTNCLRVSGLVCEICGCIYVSDSDEIKKALTNNEFAKDFSLSSYDPQKAKKDKERLSAIEDTLKDMCHRYEGSLAAYYLSPCNEGFDESSKRKFVVITSNRNVCSKDNRYIFYTYELARTILAVSDYNSDLKLVIDNKEYQIINSYVCPLEAHYIPSRFWTVGNGGGLKKKNDEKIVDLLIYSHKTKSYEIMKATEITDGECYSDIIIYKNFVKKYGLTPLNAQPVSRNDHLGSYDNDHFLLMNEKSILMECGYNVKANSRMSSAERKMLLSDIIDLKILDKQSVARHLTSFITLHTGEMYEDARDKWQSDLDFVLSYDDNKGADDIYIFSPKIKL